MFAVMKQKYLVGLNIAKPPKHCQFVLVVFVLKLSILQKKNEQNLTIIHIQKACGKLSTY